MCTASLQEDSGQKVNVESNKYEYIYNVGGMSCIYHNMIALVARFSIRSQPCSLKMFLVPKPGTADIIFRARKCFVMDTEFFHPSAEDNFITPRGTKPVNAF